MISIATSKIVHPGNMSGSILYTHLISCERVVDGSPRMSRRSMISIASLLPSSSLIIACCHVMSWQQPDQDPAPDLTKVLG